jgi:hypothetical protein
MGYTENLSNLPPGCTPADIDGPDEENLDARYNHMAIIGKPQTLPKLMS